VSALWAAPVARALAMRAEPETGMACCRRDTHSCCKKKSSGRNGAALEAARPCGKQCGAPASSGAVALSVIPGSAAVEQADAAAPLSALPTTRSHNAIFERALCARPPPLSA